MPPQPIDALARWTCIALYGCAAFYALSAAYLPSNLDQLEQAAAYERSIGQTLYLQATPAADFVVVGAAALILTAVVFLAFFHRAYANGASGEVLLAAAALTGAVMVRLIARRQRLRAQLIGERQRASFLAAPERISPQAG